MECRSTYIQASKMVTATHMGISKRRQFHLQYVGPITIFMWNFKRKNVL